MRILKLIRAIFDKNENGAYSQLANMDWNKNKICHFKDEAKLSRGVHAIQSLVCAWFFFKLFLFCAIWHPIFPNIAPHWATERLAKFDIWYAALNRKLHRPFFGLFSKVNLDDINPWDQMGGR